MRTFSYSDARSHKFWDIEQDGKEVTVRYGRQGSEGQTQKKSYASEAAARAEHDRLIAEKVLTDTGPVCDLAFTGEEVNKPFAK